MEYSDITSESRWFSRSVLRAFWLMEKRDTPVFGGAKTNWLLAAALAVVFADGLFIVYFFGLETLGLRLLPVRIDSAYALMIALGAPLLFALVFPCIAAWRAARVVRAERMSIEAFRASGQGSRCYPAADVALARVAIASVYCVEPELIRPDQNARKLRRYCPIVGPFVWEFAYAYRSCLIEAGRSVDDRSIEDAAFRLMNARTVEDIVHALLGDSRTPHV